MATSAYTSQKSFYSANGNAKYCGYIAVAVEETSATTCKIYLYRCAYMINGYGYPCTVYVQYNTNGGTWYNADSVSGTLNSHPGSSWAKFAAKLSSTSVNRSSTNVVVNYRVKVECPRAYTTNTSTGWSSTVSITIPQIGSRSVYYDLNYTDADNPPTPPAIQTEATGTAITLASAPTRTGYNFQRWNTKDDGTGTSYAAGASYNGTANLMLYAQWVSKTGLPSLSNVKITRTSTQGGDPATDGTFLSFSAILDTWGAAISGGSAGAAGTIKIATKESGEITSYGSGSNATITTIDGVMTVIYAPSTTFAKDKNYDIRVTITNNQEVTQIYEYIGDLGLPADTFIMKITPDGDITFGTDLYTDNKDDIITAASGCTISGAYYYQYGHVAMLMITCSFSSDKSITNTASIGTLQTGKRPVFPACGGLTAGSVALANVGAGIDGSVGMRFGSALSKNTSITIGITYLI